MSLQRNSALSMRTICFSKPVSELVLQTGLTRPRSWTEEVSDLGRGLFSFEFPAQIETSASREMYYQLRHKYITFRRTELWSLSTYLFRNSLVRIRIQTTIQSVIFKLVSTDFHLLFRYFRISKYLVRASTGNTN